MPSLFSWIRKEFAYIKNSFMDIIRGLIIFILASSGLGIAIILRYFDYNGILITFFGLIVEFIALILCYLLLREYLKSKKDTNLSKSKE
jgi:hypothetical protein